MCVYRLPIAELPTRPRHNECFTWLKSVCDPSVPLYEYCLCQLEYVTMRYVCQLDL